MTARKTSKAEHRSARFNPIHEDEAKALEIIRFYEELGTSFKRLVVAAILEYEGHDPSLLQPKQPIVHVDVDVNQFTGQMQGLLERFADEIIRHFKKGTPSRRQQSVDEDEDDETTQFAKNFARGFIQRQQQGLGEDDD